MVICILKTLWHLVGLIVGVLMYRKTATIKSFVIENLDSMSGIINFESNNETRSARLSCPMMVPDQIMVSNYLAAVV